MALKTLVKVSNVTNLSDARYCAGMGVEMIGFVMDKHSIDYTSPEKMKEIKSWVAGILIVGETQSVDYEEIKAFLQAYEIDILQITDATLLPQITDLGKPIILKLDFESAYLEDYLERYSQFVEFFLVDGGELSDFARYTLKEYAFNYPIVLDFGVTSNNVTELLTEMPVKGIALKGSNEIRPGYKDYDELSEILEILEED
ncbi:N-(5'-phosphoribosyl)anthranilate isomerase [Emticicia aquatica]|uniref:N-(5'-phosphoribosyl)anthranilate isomerase n=1 Tax=Emticicia aquatica TaxID=1681835 RepID=A0ABN8EV23_9BACT|nr:N-(5'-phosphoribosyl)anthranilate isomerase [Emticicia aquatica]CAH0995375.1 N-(5'-phosphoribosyl)anthranilate isomerase [Emticicia aquatica]